MTLFRVLSKNHSRACPSNLLFFDTETRGKKHPHDKNTELHTLRLGVAIACRLENGEITRRQVYRFTTIDQFWEIVNERTHPRLPLWIFAHNAGFDSTIVDTWGRLDQGHLSLVRVVPERVDRNGVPGDRTHKHGFVCDDDPPTIISVYDRSGAKILMVDTLNYWRVALSTLGDRIGLEKIEMPHWRANDDKWFTYCERDVEVLERAVIALLNWIKDNDYGMFRMSAPSQAMSAFRHRFMQHKIELHMWEPARAIERAGYYGGRLQLFHCGSVRGNVYEADITSQYPYVLRRFDYPCRLVECVEDATKTGNVNLSHPIECIAECEIESDIGDFPKRTPDGTIYPVGRFVTTLAGPELCHAYDLGCVKRIRRYSRYQLRPLFGEFIDHFFSRRMEYEQKGDKISADFCKLMMNSFYGKWGQMLQEWEDQGEWEWPIVPDHEVYYKANKRELRKWRVIGRRLQQCTPPQEHPKAFPAIAAYCTAYARNYVRELLDCAGVGNCYYVVTDALFINEEGKRRLENGGYFGQGQLGLLRIKRHSKTAKFRSIHCYRMGSYRLEGSRKKSAQRINDNTFTELKFEGLRSVLKREPTPCISISKITKHFSFTYRRGVVTNSGAVKPITLNEW